MKAILLALALVASLTACGNDTPPRENEFRVIQARLPDGKSIPCLAWVRGTGNSRMGGIDCDWHADD